MDAKIHVYCTTCSWGALARPTKVWPMVDTHEEENPGHRVINHEDLNG